MSATMHPTGASPAGSEPCPNCGDATPGNFCPECGQARRSVHLSLREMGADWVDDHFTLSAKLPRTLRRLLLCPGSLTREYLRGRVVRYIPPLRLYLAASVIFFLLLSVLPETWLQVGQPNDTGGGVNFGMTISPDDSASATVLAAEQGSWADEIRIQTPDPRLTRRLERTRSRLGTMSLEEAVRTVIGNFSQQVSTTVFLLLPVFALLLKLLYARRGRLYVEHFVFALHVHAFAFALFSAMLLLDLIPRAEPLEVVLVLWLFVYLFLAMKRVYGQGWLKTGAKYLALGGSYFLVLALGMAVTLLVTLLLL